MSATLICGISQLVTNDLTMGTGRLGVIPDAHVVVSEGVIQEIGRGARLPAADYRIDLRGRCLIPGFVDSHTHVVFAGERSSEFAARMCGQPYTGGGIQKTVAATRSASTEELRRHTALLVEEARCQGTTTVEIKSGYGLDIENELRMLQIAHEFTPEVTFLGAHVVPSEYAGRADDYVDLVCGEMMDHCAPLAKWVDVFCEPRADGAFDADQTRCVLAAGSKHGLIGRVHAAQLGPGPGARVAVECGAASIDHSTYLTDDDIDVLKAAGEKSPVVTFLPIVEYATRHPFPDARRVLDAGLTVALASDCNPGTCFSNSMSLAISLAVHQMGMSPEEALWAATAGGAAALHRSDLGRIVRGGPADLAVVDAPNHLYLSYRTGVPLVRALSPAELAGTHIVTEREGMQ